MTKLYALMFAASIFVIMVAAVGERDLRVDALYLVAIFFAWQEMMKHVRKGLFQRKINGALDAFEAPGIVVEFLSPGDEDSFRRVIAGFEGHYDRTAEP